MNSDCHDCCRLMRSMCGIENSEDGNTASVSSTRAILDSSAGDRASKLRLTWGRAIVTETTRGND